MRSIGLPELLVMAVFVVVIVVTVRSLKAGSVVGFAVAGAVLGTLLGFLVRPSVPLIGQLPLGVVLTRGAALNGVDVLLRSTAEQSFNYLIVGGVIGAVLMAGAKIVITSQASRANTTGAPPTAQSSAAPPPAGATANAFCTKCGTALGSAVTFCGACGTRREAR